MFVFKLSGIHTNYAYKEEYKLIVKKVESHKDKTLAALYLSPLLAFSINHTSYISNTILNKCQIFVFFLHIFV
jgi:hypothetical protein